MGKWLGAGSCVDGRPLTRIEVSDSAWLAAIAAIAPSRAHRPTGEFLLHGAGVLPTRLRSNRHPSGDSVTRLWRQRFRECTRKLCAGVPLPTPWASRAAGHVRTPYGSLGSPDSADRSFRKGLGRLCRGQRGVCRGPSPGDSRPHRWRELASTRVDARHWQSARCSFAIAEPFRFQSTSSSRCPMARQDTNTGAETRIGSGFKLSERAPCDPPRRYPDDRVLLDADPSNNRAAAPNSTGGTLRTLEWVTYLMQLALQTAVP